jgi:hypothetical protein
MFRKILAATAALTLALGGVLALAVPANATPPGNETKTGLCHRTASDTNPYVFIEVDDESLQAHLSDGKGHFPKQWKTDGVFRSVSHVAGDLKYDYEAEVASDCDDTTPVQPDPIVEVEEGAIERSSCEAGVEQQIITVTFTTEYVWNGKEWVLGDTVKTVDEGEWTFVRDLTSEESDALGCNPEEPPVDPEDPKDPPVDNPPQNQPPTELPGTGAGDVLPWAGLGIALLLSGLLAYMVTNRRRSSSI